MYLAFRRRNVHRSRARECTRHDGFKACHMKEISPAYAAASFDLAVTFMPSMRLPFVLCSIALAALSAALSGCDSREANAATNVTTYAATNTAPQGQSRAEVFAHV